jgi:DNA-binding NarL/FixJ family response regulator
VSRSRVLIVDDHRIVAEGLIRLLSDRFEILGPITDGSLVPEAVSRLGPDVVLLDMSLRDVSGLDVMRELRRRGMPVKIVFLTMHADAQLAIKSLRAGASGYVLKESSGEELVTALREVLAGRTYLAAGLAAEIVTLMA